jgi:hypothetical protein
MSILKLIDRIEKEFMYGRAIIYNTNNWIKTNTDYKRHKSYKTGTQTLNIIGVRQRNGSRGEGIGMGHRNKPRQD